MGCRCRQDLLADMLSLLGMTYGDEEKLETLKYRLLAKVGGSWFLGSRIHQASGA